MNDRASIRFIVWLILTAVVMINPAFSQTAITGGAGSETPCLGPNYVYTYGVINIPSCTQSFNWSITGGTIVSTGPGIANVYWTSTTGRLDCYIRVSGGGPFCPPDPVVATPFNITSLIPASAPPTPSAPTLSSNNLCAGQSFTISTTTTGSYSYYWEYSVDGGAYTSLGIGSSSLTTTFPSLTFGGPTRSIQFRVYTKYSQCPNSYTSAYSAVVNATAYAPPPSVSISVVDKTCSDSNTSGLSVTGISNPNNPEVLFQFGGTRPTNYPSSDPAFTNAGVIGASFKYQPGSYSFQVRGYNSATPSAPSCVSTLGPFTINTKVDDAAVTSTPTNQITCNGLTNGQVTINAGGTYPTFTYQLGSSGFQSSNVFPNLGPGTYTPYVKDANNCVHPGNPITINTAPSAVSVTTPASVSQPACLGSTVGNISPPIATGGVGSYTWSIGGSYISIASSFLSVSPGSYSISVQDGNGCSIAAGSVTVYPAISASYSSANASCASVADGSLTITSPSGGNGSYTYSVDGGPYQVSSTFINLSSGSHTLRVKDGTNCVYVISGATIGLKPPITATISQSATINCNGQSTGALSVSPSGGTPSYNYSWSNGVATVSSSQNPTGLPAGNYSVTITDSKGCTGNASNAPFTITQPAALSLSTTPTHILCSGGSTGAVTLTVSGGTGTKTYAWSTGATTQNISNLTAGIYSVTVTDANGCAKSTSVTLTEPASVVSVSLQSKTNVTCFGAANGVITVAASGGTGAFTYSKDGTNFQGATFTGLTPGNYTIIAKDVNGCTASTSSISITQPAAALSISGITKNNPSCNGASTGSLVVTAAGGTAPYSYSTDGTTFISSNTLSGLTAGSYVVTIKDANGCTVSSAAQSLTNPPAILASASVTAQSCAAVVDGKITVSASGGTGSLQYSIDGTTYQVSNIFTNLAAASYSVTVKDGNNCTLTIPANVGVVPAIAGSITQTAFINCNGLNTGALSLSVAGGTAPYTYSWSHGATSQNASSLPAGNYTVTITDSKSCTGTSSFSVTQPAVLLASAAKSNYNGFGVSCNGSTDGFINITVSGGSPGYTYAWSNSATTKDVSGLSPGLYSVTVTDSKGCGAGTSANITSPTTVTVGLNNKTSPSCFGGANGSIVLTGAGGAGTYSFSINNGSNWQSGVSAATFSSLTQGSYIALARDVNNCISPISLPITLTQPSDISISFGSFQNAICGSANGAVQASATGGTGTLTYQWKNSSNTVVGTSALLSNVVSGTYTVTVTDNNGCSKSSVTAIGSTNGPALNVTSIVGVACSTSTNGQAQVNITGGLAPYTVTWGSGETGTSAIQLSGGTNSVSVKDANNCVTATTFTVPAPSAITLSSTVKTSPDCVGGANGSIQVTPTGGTGAFTYQWNGVAGTSTLSNISAGTYTLLIKDSQNCTFNQSITLTDVTPISIATVNQQTPTCSTSTDGSLQVAASGGNGGFTYSWNTGGTASSISSLAGGTYNITVKDSKNCTQAKSITLVAPAPVAVTGTISSPVLCKSDANGQVSLTASGGTGSFDYSVNGGSSFQSSNVFSNLNAATLNIRARDVNGCIGSGTLILSEPTLLTTSITNTINTTCNQSNGSATASPQGGTGVYSYQWMTPANVTVSTQQTLTNAAPDTYHVVVKDANQCSATSFATIAPSTNSQFSITNVIATSCSNSADGGASINIVSAKAPYTILWSSGETSLAAAKLPGGTVSASITDADGCVATQNFSVPSPAPVTVLSEILSNPLCTGSTGSIQVTSTGGTAPYSYTWNGQPGASTNSTLKAGVNVLMVKDAKNCSFTKNYTLTDPPPFVIDLGPDKTVCSGTSVQVGISLPNTTFNWKGPGNFQSTDGTVTVDVAGVYTLTAINGNGCKAEDSFLLTLSENLLKADLIAVSKAFVNDTIIVIDISWPLPETSKWSFSSEATVMHADKDYALLKYSKAGTYPLGISATLGNCKSAYTQSIVIEDRLIIGGRLDSPEDETAAITQVDAFPNPFPDVVRIQVDLTKTATVDLKVYHLLSNKMVHTTTLEGSDNYSVELDFGNRESGFYVVVASIGKKSKAVRILKL